MDQDSRPVPLVFVGSFFWRWVAPLTADVTTPLAIDIAPGLRDEDVCPLVGQAEIVITGHWSAAMGRAATRLRFLHVAGAGTDKIDPAGIPPGVVAANCYEHERPVAEYVIMTCLALPRLLIASDQTLRRTSWELFSGAGGPLLPELGGRTIGVVGVGRIGREVARLAAPFDARCIGTKGTPVSAAECAAWGFDWIGPPSDLDRLLTESDFVVVAAPLNERTRGMFGARELRLMKPTAYVINPARAQLFDQRALYEALRDRVIAGAALDTWWHYPKAGECVAPADLPFAELPNVIMTPHTSGTTIETIERRIRFVAANLNRFLRGDPVQNIVAALSRA